MKKNRLLPKSTIIYAVILTLGCSSPQKEIRGEPDRKSESEKSETKNQPNDSRLTENKRIEFWASRVKKKAELKLDSIMAGNQKEKFNCKVNFQVNREGVI